MTDSSAEERVTVFRTNLLYSVRETIKQTRIHVGFPTSEIFPACSEIPLILSAENKGRAGGGGLYVGNKHEKDSRYKTHLNPESPACDRHISASSTLRYEFLFLVFELKIVALNIEYTVMF